MSQVIELSGINKSFPAPGTRRTDTVHAIHAVRDVSVSLKAGETLGLIGESGSGKTTLGRIAVGLERADSGIIRFLGQDLNGQNRSSSHRGQRQMVFQNPYASLDPRLTIYDSLAEPLKAAGQAKAKIGSRLAELLELIALPRDSLAKLPHQFSGGQLQRIAIARAIAAEPRLIVADEPVASLDLSIQLQILELFRNIQKETGVAYLFIGHGLQTVRWAADRVAVMLQGALVETAPASDFFQEGFHPYSQALLEASPLPDPSIRIEASGARLEPESSAFLHGEGCQYASQCPLAMDVCTKKMPELTSAGLHRQVACWAVSGQ